MEVAFPCETSEYNGWHGTICQKTAIFSLTSFRQKV